MEYDRWTLKRKLEQELKSKGGAGKRSDRSNVRTAHVAPVSQATHEATGRGQQNGSDSEDDEHAEADRLEALSRS